MFSDPLSIVIDLTSRSGSGLSNVCIELLFSSAVLSSTFDIRTNLVTRSVVTERAVGQSMLDSMRSVSQ